MAGALGGTTLASPGAVAVNGVETRAGPRCASVQKSSAGDASEGTVLAWYGNDSQPSEWVGQPTATPFTGYAFSYGVTGGAATLAVAN